jgi:hypothetical protein
MKALVQKTSHSLSYNESVSFKKNFPFFKLKPQSKELGRGPSEIVSTF